MKKTIKNIFLFSIITSYFLLLIFALNGDSVNLTSEIHELAEARTRIIWQYNVYKILLINKLNSLKENMLLFGFSCPYLKAGPVYSYGLFRELYNPLNYGIDSNIFEEKSDLKLKSSFDKTNKNFLFLKLNTNLLGNNILGLYYAERGNKPFALGLLLHMSFDNWFYSEFLFQLSKPETEKPAETWFSLSNYYPGAFINHSGARTYINLSFLSVYLSCYISGSEFLLPGFFNHIKLSSSIGLFKPEVLFGFCSKNYITPEGDMKNSLFVFEGQGELKPFKEFSIITGYKMQIDKPSSFKSICSISKENLYGTIKYKLEVMQGLYINFSASLEDSIQLEKDNKKLNIDKIILCSKIETENTCIEAEIISKYEPCFIIQFKSRLGACLGRHYFSGGCDIYFSDNMSINAEIANARFAYTFTQRDYKLFIKLFCIKPLKPEKETLKMIINNPFSCFRFSFGFEVDSNT